MKRTRPSAERMRSRAIDRSQSGTLRGNMSRRRSRRSGLTLLEILLASTILAAALAALSQQNANGVRAALRSERETEAAVLCQSKLNQLLADESSSFNVKVQSFENDKRWKWSAAAKSSPFPDLSLLTVTVYQDGVNRHIATFSLSRLISLKQRKSTQ